MPATDPDDRLVKAHQDADRRHPGNKPSKGSKDHDKPWRDIAEDARSNQGLGEVINPAGSSRSETERTLDEAGRCNDQAKGRS